MTPPSAAAPSFIVFYSWQSESSKTNRTLIGDALERAIKEIGNDPDVLVEPVIDRDTAGVPGSPDIAATIFDKIEGASLFVADVSLVIGSGERRSPNPNVLIELGYAVRALGWDRVVVVANTVFGDVEALPFDLRHRRISKYEMAAEDKPANARNNLASQLAATLRHAVGSGARRTGEPTLREKLEALRAQVARENNSSFAPVMVASTVRYPGVSREEYRQRLLATLQRVPFAANAGDIPDPETMKTGPCKGEILHLARVEDDAVTLEFPGTHSHLRVPLTAVVGEPMRHSARLMWIRFDVTIVVPDNLMTKPIRLEAE